MNPNSKFVEQSELKGNIYLIYQYNYNYFKHNTAELTPSQIPAKHLVLAEDTELILRTGKDSLRRSLIFQSVGQQPQTHPAWSSSPKQAVAGQSVAHVS